MIYKVNDSNKEREFVLFLSLPMKDLVMMPVTYK